jgi:RNA polymerase sigma-70 factor (ECF subfamily)
MDRSQFLQAFLQQRQSLFSFILSLMRDRDVAEDVFQDVALIAFDKCGEFQPGTDFRAWVREIARRRVLKAREMGGRRLVMLEPEAIDAVAAAHERVKEDVWHDREKALATCMQDLPERHRLIVTYRYRDLLAFDVIAQKLKSTSNSVQVMLTKIRKALRRCVEGKLVSGNA